MDSADLPVSLPNPPPYFFKKAKLLFNYLSLKCPLPYPKSSFALDLILVGRRFARNSRSSFFCLSDRFFGTDVYAGRTGRRDRGR